MDFYDVEVKQFTAGGNIWHGEEFFVKAGRPSSAERKALRAYRMNSYTKPKKGGGICEPVVTSIVRRPCNFVE